MLSGVKHPFPEELYSLFACKFLCVLRSCKACNFGEATLYCKCSSVCNHKNSKYSEVCRTPYFENIFTFL